MSIPPSFSFVARISRAISRSAAASKIISWLLLLLGCLALFGLSLHYVQIGKNAVSRPATSDFYKFYLSAKRLDEGYSMYWLVPPKLERGNPCHRDTPPTDVHFGSTDPGRLSLGGDLPCLGPNLNPPAFMLVMQPLSRLPYSQAWWAWAACSSLCIVASVLLLAGATARTKMGRLNWTVWGSTLLFAHYPTLANFELGQLGSLMLLLVTLSWQQSQKGNLSKAGIWLGLVIALKPFLAVLLPGLLMCRQWRTLVNACLAIFILAIIGLSIYGVKSYSDYWAVAGNITWASTNFNGSWLGFFERYFISQANSTWPTTRQLAGILASICSICTYMALLHRLRKISFTTSQVMTPILAIGLPSALLISPLGWAYYIPMLWLSTYLAWANTIHDPFRTTTRLFLILPAIMAMPPISLSPSPTINSPADWAGLDSWYFYALGVYCFSSFRAFAQK
jgi:hypothetical protein